MKLYKTEKWFNPFSIEVNGKGYVLDAIRIFDKGNVIAHTNQGWFGSNNDYDEMEINCDCVLKRKIDLDCKTAFIVKSDHDSYEPRYILYIPNSAVLLNEPEYKFYSSNHGSILKIQKSSLVEGIVITKHIFCDGKIRDIENKIRELGDKIRLTYATFNQVGSYTAEINELCEKRVKMFEELISTPIEELIKKYEVN